jgi:maltose alpha-D-glucosyltransferase/alpha-amylase
VTYHQGKALIEPDPIWYKTAVFYELFVRSFNDSNADGSGDFRGLVDKLDYLEWLGIDCIWLLPFYQSPLRDGGYDISDFYSILPEHGTLNDFTNFLSGAHSRGIRVVADFVVNHTSDQHPWFQESRQPGSPKRDWYVWSDTNEKYADARIIFLDSEKSNWTWDEEAGAYYWHRFFSHQPDLNYDNDEVQEQMLAALRFWLDLGLDGFRLDAVPYLFEREGTICENLPESHEFLRRVRREIEKSYEDVVLLAEANQWPADVVPYFGSGDECHMAFHFPLMPRMFMAARRQVRYPIVEILEQTPAIPDNAQWGIFLRNHDELTLEMVTDEERDYMYQEYAKDPRMKLNLGIRRRLAPLLENSRPESELFHAMLFSLPGTPIVYYGDEIGMGDNIYLGDRDGVRTPMQWTGDRNAGFSRADFAQLYLPPLLDPVYGYQACNIEAQLRDQHSFLQWFRRLLAVRKQHPVFGLGSFEALSPDNPAIFAFIRTLQDDVILCVNNLSSRARAAELDLSPYEGMYPIELLGRERFPRIGELPYLLTFAPHSFYWFQLVREETS